ncbi:Nnp-1 [Carabus blaptoides fortunei]
MAKSDKKYLLVAQEIKLAKILAGNNKKLRERTLKRLRKWLCDRTAAAPVSEDFFMRIWKGLFYTMWMSDKPLIQEECAEYISKLVHIGDVEASLLFFKCFLQTMVNEWFGIDYHRLDKFLMLIRRVLRQTFEVLKDANWQTDYLDAFKEILNQTALKVENCSALGLAMHIDEVYLEELAKVSRGMLSMDTVSILVQPFAQQLARVQDLAQVKHISQHIFKYLMFQSDAGIEYQERFKKWQQLGFPGGTPDALEKVEIDADEDEDEQEIDVVGNSDIEDMTMDPRAGKQDVVLPQVPFDAGAIADMLHQLKSKPYTSTRSRKYLTRLVEEFKDLAGGHFPLGIKSVARVQDDGYSMKVKSSLKRLHNFEQSVAGSTKSAKSKLAKKRKIREIICEELEKYDLQKKPKQKMTNNHNNSFVANSKTELFGNKTNLQRSPQDGRQKKKKRKHAFENGAETSADESVVTKCQKQRDTAKKLKTEDSDVEARIVNSNKFVRNSGVWHVDEFEAKVTESKATSNEWASPLQDGELDFFVVSNKTKKKLKRLSELKGQPVTQLVNDLSASVLNGKQNTPKRNVVKNPFSEATPSRGEKKIKFALNLNKSQDISEHISQVISSPGNPYDATKKPAKPLLKASPMVSPVNPFYRIKFRL